MESGHAAQQLPTVVGADAGADAAHATEHDEQLLALWLLDRPRET